MKRLYKIDGIWMAVQVVPDVIELFIFDGEDVGVTDTVVPYAHACQVKWIDNQVVATRGGLPLDALRGIFQGTYVSESCPTVLRE